MNLFEKMEENEYEQIVFCYDKETGLKAIIAVHDTTLGPAIGGIRFYDYKNEEEALYDVLRLAKGMTYKNAACGLHAGGAKSVIIGDHKKLKTDKLLKAFGRFVNRLNGTYYAGEDMNISEEDIAIINTETNYVVGRKEYSGNPAPYTALGVYQGIKAAAKEVYGSDDLTNKTIAISGIGSVGYLLAEMLKKDNANLIVADINEDTLKKAKEELDAVVVGIDDIQSVECDIFAPCAMGAIINEENADDLKCKIIAGSANNILVNNKAGDKLNKLGILYIPDYVINAGGVLNCGFEIEPEGYNKELLIKKVNDIYNSVEMIIKIAKEENIPTYLAADKYAESLFKKK